MAKALFVAWANAANPDDEEFKSWYDDLHIPEVRRAVQGIVAVHRYRRALPVEPDSDGVPTHEYFTVYELDSDDTEAASRALHDGIESGAIVLDATQLDLDDAVPQLAWYVHV